MHHDRHQRLRLLAGPVQLQRCLEVRVVAGHDLLGAQEPRADRQTGAQVETPVVGGELQGVLDV